MSNNKTELLQHLIINNNDFDRFKRKSDEFNPFNILKLIIAKKQCIFCNSLYCIIC